MHERIDFGLILVVIFNRNLINFGSTFFAKLKNFLAKLIFFPPKLLLVFWKREIFLSKKKNWREKNQLSKKVF
jgi:hypothetical protein